MTLSDIASIGSLVSGVAVLISLVYLALQVRQSDKNQRALINQGAITRTTEFLMWYGQAPLNDMATRAQSGATNLSPAELNQLRLVFRIFLLDLQDHLVQHKAGLTDEITFAHVLAVSRFWMDSPLFRVIWRHDRALYAPELAAFVDRNIESHPPYLPSDPTDRLMAELTEMQADLARRDGAKA